MVSWIAEGQKYAVGEEWERERGGFSIAQAHLKDWTDRFVLYVDGRSGCFVWKVRKQGGGLLGPASGKR